MPENYIITLECSKDALGELIATGLERHATITKVEAVTKEEPQPEPETRQPVTHQLKLAIPAQTKAKKQPKSGYQKKITGWQIYQIAIDAFHPQKQFTSRDLTKECHRAGYEIGPSAAAGHLTRLCRAGVTKKIGGGPEVGYLYSVNAVVTPTELKWRIKNGRQANT